MTTETKLDLDALERLNADVSEIQKHIPGAAVDVLLRRARQFEKVEAFLREHGEAVVGACKWPSNPEARAAVEPMLTLLRSLGLDKETR